MEKAIAAGTVATLLHVYLSQLVDAIEEGQV